MRQLPLGRVRNLTLASRVLPSPSLKVTFQFLPRDPEAKFLQALYLRLLNMQVSPPLG